MQMHFQTVSLENIYCKLINFIGQIWKRNFSSLFCDYTLWTTLLSQPIPVITYKPLSLIPASSTQTKSPTRGFRIGLGEMGITYHGFFSIPMLLNSSELISEMSRFAPARATNTSKQIETARTNIGHAPFFIYLFNLFRCK